MTTQAPIEIWERILKYAISVTLFFDPDPITNHGMERASQYVFEADYWESERIRNTLRQVCHSWDHFLQTYEHRYVLLSDVYHCRIPLAAISKAIRLNINGDYSCKCMICGPFNRMPPDALTIERKMTAVLESALGPSLGWREIASIEWKLVVLDGEINAALLELLLRRAPRIRAVVNVTEVDGKALQNLAGGLKFLHIRPRGPGSYSPQHPRWFAPSLQNLTSLHMFMLCWEGPMGAWNLPSLRHLSIRLYGSPNSSEQLASDMLAITENMGKNLITFSFWGTLGKYHIPPKIWANIPYVERVHMPYWGDHCPPDNHPVRRVRISLHILAYLDHTPPELTSRISVFDFLPCWDGRATLSTTPGHTGSRVGLIVEATETWLATLMQPRVASLGLELVSHYRDSGIVFTDAEGVTFDSYLVFAIQAYWKDGRASRLRWPRRYSVVSM